MGETMHLFAVVCLLFIPLPAFVLGTLLHLDTYRNTEMNSLGASLKKVWALLMALFFLAAGCSWVAACAALVKDALSS